MELEGQLIVRIHLDELGRVIGHALPEALVITRRLRERLRHVLECVAEHRAPLQRRLESAYRHGIVLGLVQPDPGVVEVDVIRLGAGDDVFVDPGRIPALTRRRHGDREVRLRVLVVWIDLQNLL